MKLNLGSSDRHFPGYVNVDVEPPADFLADLAKPWLWDDNTIEEIRAYDIIEHIGNCNHMGEQWCKVCVWNRGGMPHEEKLRHFIGQIHVMNEAHRVLRQGGLFDIEVPTTDGPGAWQDPQHVTYWNRNSFLYYTAGDPHRERFGAAYGVTARFKVLSADHTRFADGVVKLKIKLEAVK